MSTFNTKKKLFLITTAVVASGIVFVGCGEKIPRNPEDAEVVARINNYALTVADFKAEMRDPDIAKEEILENIITKKILLQEAQKQNFDKDRKFMKEIERYWEQALLKLLIKKKTGEFSQGITVQDTDARYEKTQEALEEWIRDLRNKASVKVDKKVLDEIEID